MDLAPSSESDSTSHTLASETKAAQHHKVVMTRGLLVSKSLTLPEEILVSMRILCPYPKKKKKKLMKH